MSAADQQEREHPEANPGEEHSNGPPFPVVGVGGSAGGLEAFTEMLENLQSSPGMAFLFVLHLERHHKSHLAEILSKVTPLKVREVSEGTKVEADHVYLIPPNTNMALADGHLTLSPRVPAPGQHMPIDHLFRSLAAIQKNRSVGVVLSGGGTDGTLGCQAIKAEGGIAFAQDERSARHASMPRAAAADGAVDYVLPPAEIARQLVRVARHPYTGTPGAAAPAPAPPDVVGEVLGLLRSATGVDFGHYKQSTVRRRLLRRMALRGLEDAGAYAEVLRTDPAELQSLYQDFLIRVTQFFRDPATFEALKTAVFPELVEGRPASSPVRIWAAGCSTGEEVYSLVISLLEFMDGLPEPIPIKVLATDLNESALAKARAGVYVDNIEIDVSAQRLRRFFVRVDGQYQISKQVRELCVFSRHNMASDPPFSHLDLVSCRNVLIYMDTGLQKRVLPILHYSLNPGGFLLLGGSESVGPFTDLFEQVDYRHRIFRRNPGAAGPPLDFTGHAALEGRLWPERRVEGAPLWTALDVQREADRIVLSRYAPVGVVVDETGTVLQFRGRTAAYLEPAPGTATLDLFRMLREGLLAEVRSAVNQAKVENLAVTREGVRLPEDGQMRGLTIEVIPFKIPPSGARFFLVLFQDGAPAPAGPAPGAGPEAAAPAADQQVAPLQQELAALREYLQSALEEQESTNEELKSANEEILSANEELQSTNEELQTAKEESQSASEELATVNEELRHRNAELARVNNDLVNVLGGVSIPIVMVGRDLRVRRFTPLA
jgi:two-component system CheB/CheR fusion protein